MSNKHTFTSYVTKSRVFQVLIDGFSTATGLISNLKLRTMRIVATMSFIVKMTLALKLRTLKFTISNSLIKLAMKFSSTISLRMIRLVATMKQNMKFTSAISLRKIVLTATAKLGLKITSAGISVKKLTLVASPQLGFFPKLSVYDPQLLSALDSLTLAAMDYTAT